jgi:hypothetical protein
MHQSFLGYSLSIFPYFWAVLIGIFLIVAFFDVRRTETGYRYSWMKIALMSIGSIIVLGGIMSYVGIGERFNGMMANGVPYYGQHMMVTRETQWSKPLEGFLSGIIVSASNDKLNIKDLSGKKWSIILSDKTLVRPRADISVGQMIKIIGIKLDGDNFQASEIRPWIGMGQGMMSSGQSQQGNVRPGSMMNKSGQGGMMRRN